MLPARERAKLAIDERNDLAREVIGVGAERGGVDVLVPAKRGEAIRKDDDRGSHLPLVDQPRRALRDIVAERLPVGVGETGSRESDEIVEHRETAPGRAVVVLWWQPHAEPAHVRIAEGVVLQYA